MSMLTPAVDRFIPPASPPPTGRIATAAVICLCACAREVVKADIVLLKGFRVVQEFKG